MIHWSADAVFYHIYPLGLTGAPQRNDFSQPPVARLEQLYDWIDHLKEIGVNAVYLGPLFESSSHGYDTVDYYQVDRRLGTNQTLTDLSAALHANGIRLVLDGVFNHVGREFWAFRDVQSRGEDSPYRDWFYNLRFEGRSSYGDPFTYEGWAGHYSLVKLNLANQALREYLFEAIGAWIDAFDLDGLRLDAADVIDPAFLSDLAGFCKSRRSDFWLLGEIVHGDYRRLVNPQTLDSATNYECYKGLYSSLATQNYFEIAYAIQRQFGEGGLYQGLPLYNFVDNHDVTRVASNLPIAEFLFPLYCLLFCMPGVPSIYYGSEWGITGVRGQHSDHALRPALSLAQITQNCPNPALAEAIARFARLRHGSIALRRGDYRQLFVNAKQFAFARRFDQEQVVVMLNAASNPVEVEVPVPLNAGRADDLLNPGERFEIQDGRLRGAVYPYWARVLRLED